MNIQVAHLLLTGEYICDIRYPQEFSILQDLGEQEEVNEWLSKLNRRLARLGEDGAFFMAPLVVSVREQAQLKTEFQQFRDVYGPAVLMLDLIRQTDTMNMTLSPGEYIPLFELEQAVVNSDTLERVLKSKVAVIDHGNPRQTVRENLRRLLEHLVKDGYAVLASKETETYRITGKIDQLYAVLQYLAENKVIPESEIDESDIVEPDLVDLAQSAQEQQ